MEKQSGSRPDTVETCVTAIFDGRGFAEHHFSRLCNLFFLPFITLFYPSSDIQRVREGHPPACLTNYKYGILMVGTLAHFFRSSIIHFESNNETAVHNHEGAFFIAF